MSGDHDHDNYLAKMDERNPWLKVGFLALVNRAASVSCSAKF